VKTEVQVCLSPKIILLRDKTAYMTWYLASNTGSSANYIQSKLLKLVMAASFFARKIVF